MDVKINIDNHIIDIQYDSGNGEVWKKSYSIWVIKIPLLLLALGFLIAIIAF